MKVVKSQVVLYMYDMLLVGKLDPYYIKSKFNIMDKTFLRYITEIRIYLQNFYRGYDLVYKSSEKGYFLVEK